MSKHREGKQPAQGHRAGKGWIQDPNRLSVSESSPTEEWGTFPLTVSGTVAATSPGKSPGCEPLRVASKGFGQGRRG